MVVLNILIVFIALVVLQRAIYYHFWNRNLAVDLMFSAKTGIEGSSVWLTEIITSRKALPLPWLVVKFHVSRHLMFPDHLHASVTDNYYREDLFSIGMYQRLSRTLQVDLHKRGYFTIRSIDLISSDLLLTEKLVSQTQSLSVLTVTPRLIPRYDLAIPYSRLVGPVLAAQALLPDPFEFRSIREYQNFDTLKSVNWLATARTGQLKVNVHEYTATREVLILLNVEFETAFDEERLVEEGIRITASLCEYLVEDGISCGLVSNACDIITGATVDIPPGQSNQHTRQVHEQLGRIDLTRKTTDFAALFASRTLEKSDDVVFLVVSLNCSLRLSHSWAQYLGQGGQGLWIIPQYEDDKERLPDVPDAAFYWELKRNVS